MVCGMHEFGAPCRGIVRLGSINPMEWTFDLANLRMSVGKYSASLWRGQKGQYYVMSVTSTADELGVVETERVAKDARAALARRLAGHKGRRTV
jgi:hypothetical protein